MRAEPSGVGVGGIQCPCKGKKRPELALSGEASLRKRPSLNREEGPHPGGT